MFVFGILLSHSLPRSAFRFMITCDIFVIHYHFGFWYFEITTIGMYAAKLKASIKLPESHMQSHYYHRFSRHFHSTFIQLMSLHLLAVPMTKGAHTQKIK